MNTRARPLRAWFVVATLIASTAGCDSGGLLLTTANTTTTSSASPPPVVAFGPSANELVTGGTVAKSGKYQVVYTFGQATPNQGVDKSKSHEDHGGLVGAMSTP